MARRQSKKEPDAPTTERVTIRHAGFQYEDADGVTRRVRRGAVIEVGGADLERGKATGAFVEHHDVPTPDLQGPEYGGEEQPVVLDPASANDALSEFGDDQLAQWVAENQPEDIAEAVVSLRDAQRVMQAENTVTNNDPRTSLMSLMEAVIASTAAAEGNTPEDEEAEDLTNRPDPGSDQE